MIFCHSLSVSQIEQALSAPRLASYQSLIGAGAPPAAVGAYVWGLELNAALGPLLSMLEVVLRNSMHRAACAATGKPDWYQDVLKQNGNKAFLSKMLAGSFPNLQFYRKGCAPYDKKKVYVGTTEYKPRPWRSAPEAKREDILDRLTKAGKPHSPDQIVANAMFGFWLDLFDPSFEDASDPLSLWPRCQAVTFPHDATMTRAKADTYLRRAKELRNRLSHHEPIWRIANPLTPAGVHTSLTLYVQEMREVLHAMSPDVVMLLENTGSWKRIEWLLDPTNIASFAGQASLSSVDLRKLHRTVRKIADSAVRRARSATASPGRAIHVEHGGQTILTVMPHV